MELTAHSEHNHSRKKEKIFLSPQNSIIFIISFSHSSPIAIGVSPSWQGNYRAHDRATTTNNTTIIASVLIGHGITSLKLQWGARERRRAATRASSTFRREKADEMSIKVERKTERWIRKYLRLISLVKRGSIIRASPEVYRVRSRSARPRKTMRKETVL